MVKYTSLHYKMVQKDFYTLQNRMLGSSNPPNHVVLSLSRELNSKLNNSELSIYVYG